MCCTTCVNAHARQASLLALTSPDVLLVPVGDGQGLLLGREVAPLLADKAGAEVAVGEGEGDSGLNGPAHQGNGEGGAILDLQEGG